MKKLFLILSFLTAGELFLFSCNQTGLNPKTEGPEGPAEKPVDDKPENKDEDSEDELEPAEDFFIDYSKMTFWDTSSTDSTPCGSFDSDTNKCHLNVQWKAGQIWLGGFDASNYRYIKIEYSNASSTFRIQCIYQDGSADLKPCESARTSQYLKLDKEKRNYLKSITLWNTNGEKVEFTLDSLSFTQDYVLPAPVIDDKSTGFNSDISACSLVREMGAGWNLSNNLEAHPFSYLKNPCDLGLDSETIWSEPKATKEIIELGKKYGYKTIRIPVTWYNHIVDGKYTIDSCWMARVKQVVDWAYDAGYYVILNEHHSVHGDKETTFSGDGGYNTRAMNSPLEYGDGYIIRNNETDIAESKKFLKAVWTQIGQAFNKGYNERLIFETLNEPRNTGHYGLNKVTGKDASHEWEPGLAAEYAPGKLWADFRDCAECIRDYEILNEMNQVCLDAIRGTGGNNSNRFVMIPGLCTSDTTILEDRFKLPQDTASDKLILTVHNYIMGSGSGYGKTLFTEQMEQELKDKYERIYQKFISEKNIPVVVGETGAPHFKEIENENGQTESVEITLSERLKWISYFGNLCRSYGMAVCYWDCGGIRKGTMAELDRINLCPYEPEFVSAFIESMK